MQSDQTRPDNFCSSIDILRFLQLNHGGAVGKWIFFLFFSYLLSVEEQMNSHILTSSRPNGSTESEKIGGETCPDVVIRGAPIKLVDGRPWSPGIY
jgi:hypothetical protein